MNRYRVELHARHTIVLDDKGQKRLGGMYTLRVVSADSPEEAATIASTELLLEEELRSEVWNESMDEIRVEVEDVEELDDDADPSDSGYVFYIDDDSEIIGE